MGVQEGDFFATRISVKTGYKHLLSKTIPFGMTTFVSNNQRNVSVK